MLGARDLRAFCRPPMGVPVEFAGVSTYQDGQQVCGLFDRPIDVQSGMSSAQPQLRLPRGAFSPMPKNRDRVSVTDEDLVTMYEVSEPTAEGDGSFLVYDLHQRGEPAAAIEASADNGQSIANDVLDAAVQLLGGNQAGTWRCRFRTFGVDELPARNVLPDTTAVEYASTGDTDRTFRFFVRHLVQAEDDAQNQADALAVLTTKQLMLDPTLGGLVRYTREAGARWEMEEQDQQLVAYVVTFEVEFSTSRTDPSRPGF